MKKRKLIIDLVCCIISCLLLTSGATVLGTAAGESTAVSGASQTAQYADVRVYAGGMPFGVRFDAGEVVVVKTSSFYSDGITVSPAGEAGILANDVITDVNGTSVNSVTEVIEAIKNAGESGLTMTVKRGKQETSVRMTPKKCDENGEYRLGLLLKDSAAGIGTVTYISEDSLVFAGLGHGICDSTSGALLKIDSGYISKVQINGVNKGLVGTPGELRGNFVGDHCGKLLANTEVGVFGIYTDKAVSDDTPVKVAERWEVETGPATIYCTLFGEERAAYTIRIEEINHDSNAKTKNFIVRVTDPVLLEKTGGIVQGMSGSPIFQNGKLIGAITHVMINDPTTGYGIYIGNMLDEMKNCA